MEIQTPPPPAPRMRSTATPVMAQQAKQARSIVIRWDTLVTMAATLMVGMALGMAALMAIQQVIVDDHGGYPRCTDAIADAHGICWGEPE